MKTKIILNHLFLILMLSCQQKKMDFNEELMRNQADSTMSAYQDAISEHHGERMISFYLNSPDFEVIANGEFVNYNDWVKITKDSYSGIREVRGGFSNFHTIVMGSDAVLISGLRDQTMVDTSNAAIQRIGTASWVWIKRDGRWSIIHINTNYAETKVQ